MLAALEGAGMAHVAAHASFRADNGLWSSLELADGVLTVYELEQLRRPPQVVVLSACQSGLSAVRPGDEVMGLVAALLDPRRPVGCGIRRAGRRPGQRAVDGRPSRAPPSRRTPCCRVGRRTGGLPQLGRPFLCLFWRSLTFRPRRAPRVFRR